MEVTPLELEKIRGFVLWGYCLNRLFLCMSRAEENASRTADFSMATLCGMNDTVRFHYLQRGARYQPLNLDP